MITLICGLPNAGKTTYSKSYEHVIHFDDIEHETVNEQFERCNALASTVKGDICVEGVYNSVKRRKEFLKAVKGKGCEKVCIWIDTSLETCLAREQRNRPPGIICIHNRRFEPPTPEEGWDKIIRIV